VKSVPFYAALSGLVPIELITQGLATGLGLERPFGAPDAAGAKWNIASPNKMWARGMRRETFKAAVVFPIYEFFVFLCGKRLFPFSSEKFR
jgi:hypothetical protein